MTMDAPEVNSSFDERYQLLSVLGEGAMGKVYRARDVALGVDVAVKVMQNPSPAYEKRFLREARAHVQLASPNIVRLFDFGRAPDGDAYLAMELLEGETLADRLERVGRLPAAAAVDCARQILRALAAAHAKGILHRDLKPANVFFARISAGDAGANARSSARGGEVVKVLDFGVAKMIGDGADSLNAIETQQGMVFGTPLYMSPEQAQGKRLDARSDLYSLGALLYHMLTGAPPFEDDNAVVVMSGHIASIARPVAEVCRDVPSALSRVVARTMAKPPAARPSTADELSEILAASLAPVAPTPDLHEVGAVTIHMSRRSTRRKKLRSVVAGTMASVIGLGVLALAVTRDPVTDDPATIAPPARPTPATPATPATTAPFQATTDREPLAASPVTSIAPITLASPSLLPVAARKKAPARPKTAPSR
jgi:eukaryotic-like serine/threonine-protein kinase